jgi:hypothetical protein
MPFNRFKVERADGGRLMSFGYQTPSGVLAGSFCCFISDFDLRQNRERCVKYAEKLTGVSDTEPTTWAPPGGYPLASARFIQLSRADDTAEIMLVSFALHALVRADKPASGVTIATDLVALLCSDVATHRAFILALFEAIQ